MKKIVILGSTGSIGMNAVRSVKNLGAGWRVIGLSVRSNTEKLLEQIKELSPEYVSVFDAGAAKDIKGQLPAGVKLLPPGKEGLAEIASLDEADIVLNSVSGAVGFEPLIASIKAGKTIALANKEPMVMAGKLIMEEARKYGARILPVDSEPSAIFQCLQNIKDGGYDDAVRRILLTASGGPFYNSGTDMSSVTPEQALKHPRWSMGKKITVDSSTLMNKGLEAIEIKNLFSLPISKVQVLIHPQSIFHSGVEFTDGAVLAQLGQTSMTLPIQYALTWPDRRPSLAAPLDFYELAHLDFYRPDFSRFPCLGLAFEVGATEGLLPAAMSAADETAVNLFLEKKIKFTDIFRIVDGTVAACDGGGKLTFENVMETDRMARAAALAAASRL